MEGRVAPHPAVLGGYFFGVAEGLGDGRGDGLVVAALLAIGLLEVLMIGVATGLGPWLAK